MKKIFLILFLVTPFTHAQEIVDTIFAAMQRGISSGQIDKSTLIHAISEGNIKAVIEFIEREKNLNQIFSVKYQRANDPTLIMEVTPLGVAVQIQSYEITKLLLHAGASPNKLSNGILPLHSAVCSAHAKLVDLLLAYGAHADTKPNPMEPMTAFEVALMHCSISPRLSANEIINYKQILMSLARAGSSIPDALCICVRNYCPYGFKLALEIQEVLNQEMMTFLLCLCRLKNQKNAFGTVFYNNRKSFVFPYLRAYRSSAHLIRTKGRTGETALDLMRALRDPLFEKKITQILNKQDTWIGWLKAQLRKYFTC